MRKQASLVSLSVFGLVALVFAGSPSGAAQQGVGIAVVDNARVFDESNQGKAATEQIQANFSGWQEQITALETELQGLLTQRQQQASVMTADALRTLDAEIEQKRIDLQRRRDDAQRQFTQIQTQILDELESQLTPVVGQVADDLGYTAVFNSQTPGLLYFNQAADITDELIARLNAMDR